MVTLTSGRLSKKQRDSYLADTFQPRYFKAIAELNSVVRRATAGRVVLENGDPDGFRGRTVDCRNHVCWRTAGRSGRSHRPSSCRPGWQTFRPGVGRLLQELKGRKFTSQMLSNISNGRWQNAGQATRFTKKPRASEIEACRPWLEAELQAVEPQDLGLPGRECSAGIVTGKIFVFSEIAENRSSPLSRRL